MYGVDIACAHGLVRVCIPAAQFLASKVEKAATAAAAADTQLPDAVGPSIEKLDVAPVRVV